MFRKITGKTQENVHEAGNQGREEFEGYFNNQRRDHDHLN